MAYRFDFACLDGGQFATFGPFHGSQFFAFLEIFFSLSIFHLLLLANLILDRYHMRPQLALEALLLFLANPLLVKLKRDQAIELGLVVANLLD